MNQLMSISTFVLVAMGLGPVITFVWPDKIYHITSADIAEEVSSRQLLPGEPYIVLSANGVPSYFNGNRVIDLTSFTPRAADTMTLRVICRPSVVTSISPIAFEILKQDLQSRARALYLGQEIKWCVDTGMVMQLNDLSISNNSDPQQISGAFNTDISHVTIIVDSIFTGIYHADASYRIIRMTSAGLNSRILLHEIGHILDLPHATTCCNICTNLSNHFMYQYLSQEVVIDQIMIQDWLQIIDSCSTNPLCNDCEPVTMISATDDSKTRTPGGGGSHSYFNVLQIPLDTPENKISIFGYLNCIDCSIDDVDLLKLTLKDLIHLYNSIPQPRKLRKKFHEEFEHYNSGALAFSSAEVEDYVETQVQQRRRFHLERVTTVLDEFMKTVDLQNIGKFKMFEKLNNKVKSELNAVDKVKKN